MNIFYEGVAPEMRTPRDVARFANSLAVTWPAIAGEVDPADFVALEVLRLLHPHTYRAIRQNKDSLCNSATMDRTNDKNKLVSRYEDLFLRQSEGIQRERLRRTLMRIFPILEAVWNNVHYGEGSVRKWASERRVCSAVHFDGYFRFTVGTEVLSASELDVFIAKAIDPAFVVDELRKAVTIGRPAGGTKAAVILDELNVHTEKVQWSTVQPLLKGLFEVADEINVEADCGGAFNMTSNELRLHWLMRSLTRDRLSLEERSAVYLAACQSASLGWLANFTDSAWTDYHHREGVEPAPEGQCLTTEADAQTLREILRGRIADAAKSGALLDNGDLLHLLHSWWRLSTDGGAALRDWTTLQLATDGGVKKLAIAFTRHGWKQGYGFSGLGDLVAQRTTNAQVQSLERLIDIAVFRRRVEEVAAAGGAPEVTEFLNAWQHQEHKASE
jgi:predicted KAP-like P-loop ATPase